MSIAAVQNAIQNATSAITGGVRSNATTGSSSSSSNSSSTNVNITANDFLTLLVTELKNQDPTSTQDPNEYVNQLVQINSLEQLIGINSGVTKLDNGVTISGISSSASSQSSAVNQSGVMANYASQSPASALANALNHSSK